MSEQESLCRIHDAILRSGKMKECSAAIASRRRWRPVRFKKSHPMAGEVNWWETYRRWQANVCHQLDVSHRFQLSVGDLELIEEILGFDPRKSRPLDPTDPNQIPKAA